jgi:hypothetical protein
MSTKKGGRKRIPVQSNTDNSDKVLKQKLQEINKLKAGMDILKERMTGAKEDLIDYFDDNPGLKDAKYAVGSNYIRYVDRKQTDGLSQKLIIRGLSKYFKANGSQNVEDDVSRALACILNERGSKIVPAIDITKNKSETAFDSDEE